MMGYFSNGSEGDSYEAQYCSRCVHLPQSRDKGCPVFGAHFFYNYEQSTSAAVKDILTMLIPRDERGANGQCALFYERGGKGGGQPEPLPLPFTVVKAA
jgi:hypothetical protein